MAGEGYQVTKSLAAEKAAIKRVTAEIQKLTARKNASTTAIRSWRFKYMAWKNRVTITDHKKIEDEVTVQVRTIRAYNRGAGKLATWRSLTAGDNLSQKSREIGLLRRHLAHLQSFEINEIADTIASAEAKLGQYEQAIEQMKRAEDQHREQEAAYEDNKKLQQKYQKELAIYEDAEKVAQQEQGENEDLQAQYQQELKAYHRQVERYSAYRKAIDRFDDSMDQFLAAEDKREEIVEGLQDVATRLNQNDYSIKIVDVDEEKLELRPTSSGVDTVAGTIITSYRNYRDRMGLDRFFELGLIATLGNPDFSTAIAEAESGDLDGAQKEITRVLSVALEQYLDGENGKQELVQARQAGEPEEPKEPEQVSRPVEPEKPQLKVIEHAKKPVEPEKVAKPKEIEPIELPAFTEVITYTPSLPENMVDEKMVAELDGYATGSYDNTRGHFEELNSIAERIGAGCPKITIIDTTFSANGLISSLSELEGAISSFGGQRNSQIGDRIISRLKAAESELKSAGNFEEFQSASRQFDTASTSLLAWVSMNWWQEGGKPSGKAHPWKPQAGTRRLVTKKKK